jgi:hypothetical protein
MIEYATSIKYMLAGYTVIFLVLSLYILSLFIRWRTLMRDLISLKEFQKKG